MKSDVVHLNTGLMMINVIVVVVIVVIVVIIMRMIMIKLVNYFVIAIKLKENLLVVIHFLQIVRKRKSPLLY